MWCHTFAGSPIWVKAGWHIYIKGVTERFGFDVSESRKFKLSVKDKATGTSHGVYHIYNPSQLMALCRELKGCIIYLHRRGAFSVVHSKMIFHICYLLDYQQVHDNTNVSIILLGDKKEPTK